MSGTHATRIGEDMIANDLSLELELINSNNIINTTLKAQNSSTGLNISPKLNNLLRV